MNHVQIDCIFDGKRFYNATEIFSRDVGDEYRFLHLFAPASSLKTFTFGSSSENWKEWGGLGPTYPIEVSKAFPKSNPSSWW